MRIFEVNDEEEAFEPGRRAEGYSEARAAGRSPGIWILTVLNLLLAGLCAYGIVFLAGARQYLTGDSAQFGASLDTTLAGLTILRIACFALVVGFALSALCVISLTRVGFWLQILWALVACATIAGIVYALVVLVFMLRRPTRDRFFARPAPISGRLG
jgi:hypothetical protein